MRLSERERQLLGYLSLKADASISQIQKATGLRTHTIQYSMQKLHERGLVRPHPFLNVNPLGYTEYALFFTVNSENRQAFVNQLESLARARHVSWLVQFSGLFEFGIGILARDSNELNRVILELSTAWGVVFLQKSISVRTSTTIFDRRYLSGSRSGAAMLSADNRGGATVSLSDLDRKILHALANYDYVSYRELSRRLQMPQTTMSYRIKRLEDQNVIVGWFLPMASRKLGMHGFRLLIDLKYPTPGIKHDIQSFCEQHPSVIGMVNCLGNWEYELQVEVDDPEQIATLKSELQRHFKVINNLHVLTMLKEYRYSSFPIDGTASKIN